MNQTKLRLAATSSQTRRMPFIDFLRGFACLWVVGTHAHAGWADLYKPKAGDNILQSALMWFLGMGSVGVDLFIVISGFCLFYPLIQLQNSKWGFSPVNARLFFIRRAQRILPVYYVVVLICSVLLIGWNLKFAPFQSVLDILPYLFTVQNWIPSHTPRINGSLWSVAMEVQLYLLLPFLVALIRRYSLVTVAAVSVGGAMLAGIASKFINLGPLFINPLAHTAMPVHFGEFVFGAVAAYLVKSKTSINKTILFSAAIACFCIGVLGHTSRGGPVLAGSCYTSWGLFFCIVIIGASRVRQNIWEDNPIYKTISRVGLVSYSMYAVHFPIVLMLDNYKNTFGNHPLKQLLAFCMIGFPAILLATLVMFHFIERRSVPAVRLQK